MATPKFNDSPRMVTIQPINGVDIYFYAVAMDFPNSMCNANPFAPGITPVESGNILNISLQDGINFPEQYDFDSDFTDFTTYLAPLYTNYVYSKNGPKLTQVIVTDSNNVQKGGELAQSKPVIKFEDPVVNEADLENIQPLYVFRPFVLINSSYATNAYFVGALVRVPNGPSWGRQFDQIVATTGGNLLVTPTMDGGIPSDIKYYNMIALFPAYKNQYSTINCDLFNDPKSTGYYIQDGSSLYDTTTLYI